MNKLHALARQKLRALVGMAGANKTEPIIPSDLELDCWERRCSGANHQFHWPHGPMMRLIAVVRHFKRNGR